MRVSTALRILAPLSIAFSCAGRSTLPRIVYINAEPELARVIGAATRQSEGVAVIPLPASRDAAVTSHSGDAGEVDLAEAAVAIPGIAAVIGHPSSRASLLAAPIYGEAGVPFIAPTATSRRLRDAGPWTFQLAPDDQAEGAFIAGFALDTLGARAVSVFYVVADEYGVGLRDGVVQALRRRGVAPADQVAVLEDSDFPRRVGASLRRAAPQAIVIAARTAEAAAIARSIRARLPAVPIILGDGVVDAGFSRAAGPATGPCYAVAWWRPESPDAASRAFVATFERVFHRAPLPHEAMYYDAVMVAAEAVREAGPRRTAIQRWLRGLGVTHPPYRGVTGPIAFTRDRPVNLVMERVGAGAAAASR